MNNNQRVALVLTALGLLAMSHSAAAQQAPERSITQITGDLYRAQNGGHFTVFLVTSEGIMLADPISTDFARWLDAELERRFGMPVRYVLYTHHHWDHASGGAAFADTAEFVGHETMPAELELPPADTPLTQDMLALDANRSGRIERAEVGSGEMRDNFALYDADGDGSLRGAEIARGPLNEVHPPQTLYDGRETVTLGGKSVEMIHLGPAHAADMTALLFPAERAVFVCDIISLKRVPFRTLQGYDLDDWLAKIRAVEALDFDIAIPAHGEVGTKADIAAFRGYLEELRAQVAAGIAAGKTLEELQATIMMSEYRDWISYDDWRTENIAGMYRMLSAPR